MATAQAPRPLVGDTLLVIHAFQARSSDELTLAKGDKVELIERDDEFGDGWFLGRHMINGNTGLFPEVYTRPAAKPGPIASFASSKPLSPLQETVHDSAKIDAASAAANPNGITELPAPNSISQTPQPAPLSAIKSDMNLGVATPKTSVSLGGANRLNSPSQDSQVLNDTLNVIDEHITNLRSAPSSNALRTNDSGSEYSVPLDRLSYIQGEETDEEEQGSHTREEVEGWNADQVADYLLETGVEKQHCDVFREQEISGEVLLGMDQNSLFINAFNLGSVGRRLKTWHKIKALQDETTGFGGVGTKRNTQTYGSDIGSEDARKSRGRTNTPTTASTGHRPSSVQTGRLSIGQTPKASPTTLGTSYTSSGLDSPQRPNHAKRPSAASIRDMNHSRRHSTSTDFRIGGAASGPSTPRLTTNGTFPMAADASHKKQPSFDRNWSLGHAFSQNGSVSIPPRPLSSTGLHDITPGSEPELQEAAAELDRGYFSGTDSDQRRRNVLKKNSISSAKPPSKFRNSYAEEQRVRSATALSRHSRFSSVDSVRDHNQGSAAQKYYAGAAAPHRRTASTNTQESYRPPPPAKDGVPPTVTKLDTALATASSASPSKSTGFRSDWFASVVHKPIGKAGGGMRALSDSLGRDRKIKTPVEPPPKDPINSPTESSVPSTGQSFEIDSPDMAKSPITSGPAASGKKSGRKSKKETSAYTKGLMQVSPKVAMQDADYSGWMRKKSSNLMTAWKPRFFVLKGRRLSYYYSEDDDGEKGLIDISFHRVLPADNEKLTGLHATITGVVDRSNHASEDLVKGDDSMFVFKLVPPRTGLNKAVNFTKPTVHYFAVPSLKHGRLWMAALMKATIDRDDSQPLTTTYQQKTISLAKARQMRHRPPALMNLEEGVEDDQAADAAAAAAAADQPPPPVKKDSNSLGIYGEADSGVAGMDKLANQRVDASTLDVNFDSSTSLVATGSTNDEKLTVSSPTT